MFAKRFIDRPILSAVISITILFVGVIGYYMLPVEQYPDIAPPTISVRASYTGANAATLQKSVVVPLEEAINGVENMLYMSSSASSTGSASVSVFFRQGTDPDMAMVNVQNRIASAQGLLPAEVVTSGVNVYKSQTSSLKMLALYSPDGTFDHLFISNYLKINVEPRLARVAGVGETSVLGPSYALRVWLDPVKMAQYELMPSDISTALSEQNIEYPTGTLAANSTNAFQFDLAYKGRLEDNVDFENIVLKSLSNGEVLRLKDVATIELGGQDYTVISNVNGCDGRLLIVYQTAGSNAMEVTEDVDKELDDIIANLPKGLKLIDIYNIKEFLDASFRNVYLTLLQAILLVVLVVYIFLQNFRATLIPTAAIIVSLVGTFAFILMMGFSLNLLTLFALVLVIGTVVDDAIVVVEATQTKFDDGEKSPYLATIGAMKEVTSALITTTIVFMAVFIPVSFMGGTTGKFYTQFGLTMAVAVALSTFNALTLSPALCALILTPHREGGEGEKGSFSARFHEAFDRNFNRMVDSYKNNVLFFLKHKVTAFTLVVLACGGLYYFMNTTKTALVPNEDMGAVFLNVQTAPGYSYLETEKVALEIEKAILQIDEVYSYNMVIGRNRSGVQGGNAAMYNLRLKDWSERPDKSQSVDAVIQKLYALTSHITSASIMAMAPPMISGYGSSNGFSLNVQDRSGGDIETLEKYTTNFIQKLSEREEIGRVQTSFDTRYPQYSVEVDAALCKRNGVSPLDVLKTISGYIGGNYVSNINKFSKLYRVIVQAPIESRLDVASMENMFVRSSDGQMSPVSQYVTLERVYGAQTLTRFNMFSSISISGMPADGYSSGQAIEAVHEVAAEVLPVGYGYEFSGLSREEADSSTSATLLVFVICVVFVYLILCGLYESFFVPLAVILSVPFGLVGSYLFINLMDLSSDIYTQTGIIMLIGLLAKTAILLTEYASERRRQGLSITQAAIIAAKVRLRPILMTSLTLIFGMLPLVFASGVGANGNISLGVGVVGGMFVGTIALIFIVPALFVIFQNIEEKLMPKRVLPEVKE